MAAERKHKKRSTSSYVKKKAWEEGAGHLFLRLKNVVLLNPALPINSLKILQINCLNHSFNTEELPNW